MKDICKHCHGAGTKPGPLGTARCQPCDGEGFIPMKLCLPKPVESNQKPAQE